MHGKLNFLRHGIQKHRKHMGWIECNLAKVGVEGSNPFARSSKIRYLRHFGGLSFLGQFLGHRPIYPVNPSSMAPVR
jgi:hypothetical protein